MAPRNAVAFGQAAVEVLDQRLDVDGALAQRRHPDPRHADAVVQVAPKTPGLDFDQQVAVRHAQQPHIDAPRPRFAKAADDAFLECAQQHRLQIERQFADLVQAQRAAMRELEAAGAAFVGGAGEGAANVAEQFAADQFARRRTTVEGDERAAAIGVAVDGACEQFLADAGLALNQHRHAPTAELARPVDHHAHRRAAPEQGAEGAARGVDLGAAGVVTDAPGRAARHERQAHRRRSREGLWHGPWRWRAYRRRQRQRQRQRRRQRGQRRGLYPTWRRRQHATGAARHDHQRADVAAVDDDRVQPLRAQVVGQMTCPIGHPAAGLDAGQACAQAQARAGQAAAAVDQHGVAVEDQQRGGVERAAELQRGFEQVDVVAAGALAEHGFDLARHGHGQHQVADLIGRRRAGNVDHAEDLVSAGNEHRRGRAGPAFDAFTVVFGSVHLHRPAHHQRGADAVRADHALVPVAAGDKMNLLRGVKREAVAGNFQNHAVRVGQQHDRTRALQQVRRVQEQRPGGPQQVGVAPAQLFEHIAVRRHRRAPPIRRHAGAGAALP